MPLGACGGGHRGDGFSGRILARKACSGRRCGLAAAGGLRGPRAEVTKGDKLVAQNGYFLAPPKFLANGPENANLRR